MLGLYGMFTSNCQTEALGPWLAAEIPYLIEAGVVTHGTGTPRLVARKLLVGGHCY